MKIDLYALCWNEERFLPYFLRHYSPLCRSITIWDNESTDGSLDIISSYPNTKVVQHPTGNEIRDDLWLEFKNTSWKESRGAAAADWVLVVDLDEIVYHPRLLEYLEACKAKGITLAWTVGYEMVSERFPETSGQIYEDVTDGVRDEWYSKPAIFDPNAITEINYEPGAHTCNPTGRVSEDHSPDLKLLHYRFLGLDYVLPRFEARRRRQSSLNKQRGWGYHFQKGPREIKRWYKSVKKQARPVL